MHDIPTWTYRPGDPRITRLTVARTWPRAAAWWLFGAASGAYLTWALFTF